ncbi:MAG: DNA mismatch repair endonuclease MutL [Thermoanaerobaculia bacterium]
MGIIKILPENLINQIAAGEVIERPSSVLKELVENSLDAGAEEVEVDFSKGGKEFISVKDNGSGMDSEDILLCIERHATSKISKFEDLFKINTLGFRGEALPSIASVSKTIILTSRDGKEGYKLEIEGGKVKEFEPFFHPKGTTIIVKNLFFNVPARKKFLRSDGTEKKYFFKVFNNFVLSFPNVSFKLKENGKVLLNFEKREREEERFLEVYGEDLKDYIEIKEKMERDMNFKMILIRGNIPVPPPNIKQLFLNRRAVWERLLYKYISEKYPKSSWVLFLKIPPEFVDVNIHPAKAEVKFQEPSKIISLFEVEEKSIFYLPIERPSIPSPEKNNLLVQETLQIPEEKYNFRFLSQISGTFLLFEEEKGLIILDPHAAHERILFESLMEKRKEKQYLITPLILEINLEEREEFREMEENLKEMGFEIDLAGEKMLKISSTPLLFEPAQALYFIKQILNNRKKGNMEERIISSLACRKALWFSRILREEEALKLYYDLKKCKEPNFCPHGRPTFIKFSEEKLLKLFERQTKK